MTVRLLCGAVAETLIFVTGALGKKLVLRQTTENKTAVYHLPRKPYPINSENFKSGNGNKK